MSQKELEQFGRRVRDLRQQQGLSQEELAYRAGIDRSYLGGVERGERNVALQNILRIASGLGVDPSVLFSVFEGPHD